MPLCSSVFKTNPRGKKGTVKKRKMRTMTVKTKEMTRRRRKKKQVEKEERKQTYVKRRSVET